MYFYWENFFYHIMASTAQRHVYTFKLSAFWKYYWVKLGLMFHLPTTKKINQKNNNKKPHTKSTILLSKHPNDYPFCKECNLFDAFVGTDISRQTYCSFGFITAFVENIFYKLWQVYAITNVYHTPIFTEMNWTMWPRFYCTVL